jgi:hypothetical protein
MRDSKGNVEGKYQHCFIQIRLDERGSVINHRARFVRERTQSSSKRCWWSRLVEVEIENRDVFGLRIERGKTVVVWRRRGEDAGIRTRARNIYTRTSPRRDRAEKWKPQNMDTVSRCQLIEDAENVRLRRKFTSGRRLGGCMRFQGDKQSCIIDEIKLSRARQSERLY